MSRQHNNNRTAKVGIAGATLLAGALMGFTAGGIGAYWTSSTSAWQWQERGTMLFSCNPTAGCVFPK